MIRMFSSRQQAPAVAAHLLPTLGPIDTTPLPLANPPGAAGVEPEPPRVGSMLGNYELLSRLGQGTTSIVFEGRHRKLQIPVAVKILHRDAVANSPQLIKQLVSEAILLARLNHPHVVRLWDLNDEGAYPYLVLEFVRGKTLAELIHQQVQVPVPYAIAIIRQAVEGLAEAHKLGIVHRDVKPGNLLIGHDGVVKVADLGLAMVISDRLSRQTAGNAAEGLPAGTAAYLAPEQARDAAQVDFRADIYSLGGTLYHALTGRLPFEGRSPMEVIQRQLREQPPAPRTLVPDLSEELSDLILRMLAKDPTDRFASYDELRVALARVVGDRRAPRPLAESFLAFAMAKKA
jgi:serine/threonine protein kinase